MDPLLISMVGLSRWESVFVQTTVDLASGMEIAPWKFVDDPNGADVLLVDADRRGDISTRDSETSRRPIVVSFTADPDPAPSASTRGLTRPVGYTDLISVLQDIEQQLHDAAKQESPQVSVVSMKVAPKPDTTNVTVLHQKPTATPIRKRSRIEESLLEIARPARRFVEDTRLVGLLKTILRHGSSAALKHPKFPTVLVIPGSNAFVSFGDPTLIPKMFRDSASSYKVSELDPDVEARALASDRRRPLELLLYCAALYGSEGRLVLNCRPDDTLCLIGLPNFDTVPHLPEHRKIASYMISNSTHLADIASTTGVSISVIIDFCNACEAVGLLRRISDTGIEYPQDVDERGVLQLFGRVRDLFKEP